MILCFVIRNTYIWSFNTVSDTELLKPLEFQKRCESKGVFCYVKDLTLEAPKAGGWLPVKPTMWLEGWKFQCHSLTHPRPPEEWRLRRLNQETNVDIYTLLCVKQIMLTCDITQGLSPPAFFNLSQHQGLFQWVSSLHQVAKVLEIQHEHQSFQSCIFGQIH